MPYTAPRLRPMLRPLIVAVTFLLALSFTASASADDTENPNNMSCSGFIKKGTQDPADPETGVIEYTVGCSGKLSGYALLSSNAINQYETEIFGVDFAKREIVATDFFSCGGDSPGFAVNCVGSTSWGWRLMTGTFAIDGDVCAEPRTDVLLMATSIVNGKQAITGPYDLGRPRGCPRTSSSGRTLFPKDVLPNSRWGGLTPAVEGASKPSKAAKKPAKKAKKAAAKRKARRA